MVPGNFEGAIVLLNILFFHIIGVLRYQHTPRLTIFQKKMFFALSDRSYSDLSFKKIV